MLRAQLTMNREARIPFRGIGQLHSGMNSQSAIHVKSRYVWYSIINTVCLSRFVYWALFFPMKRMYWQRDTFRVRHVCICKAESVRIKIKFGYIFSTVILNTKVCIIWFPYICNGKDFNIVMTSKVTEELISYEIMPLSNKTPFIYTASFTIKIFLSQLLPVYPNKKTKHTDERVIMQHFQNL